MYQIKNLMLCSLMLACISSCGQKSAWKGTLVYQYAGDINEYSFAAKKDRTIFKEAAQPFVSSAGDVVFISNAFRKRGYLVRKRTPAGQFRDLLDLSSENPDYKEALEAYSVIRGTGISGVVSSISDPKLSPNGKYLSVTVYGYKGQAFEHNCVAVFDVASKKLVTKFNDKYYGAWMPDGRLVMSGWHKKESVDGQMYKGSPGIFVADAALANYTRIDKDFDDPAPYHATPSPDGKHIAFIMNNHLWIMNADGTGTHQLTDVDNDNIETFPAWSPDGSNIACWVYKTFERSYFTAIAIVPSKAAKPVVLSDKAVVWPLDPKGKRLSGGTNQLSWK